MKLLISLKKRLAAKSDGHEVFRNMAVLAVGAGLSRLIGLLAIPVLTRLYTPAHFGALSVFTALVMILAPLVTLRYVVALPLPQNDRLAINLLALSLVLVIVGTSILSLLIWLLGPMVLAFFSMEGYAAYWWLLPLGVLGASFYEILTHWATRKKLFVAMAKSQFWQMLLGSGVKIAMGLLAMQQFGLIVGQVVQQSGGVVTLAQHVFSALRRLKAAITSNRIVFLLYWYRDLPRYRLPSQFLMVFSTQAPLLFSAWLFGAQVTGQLGLALMSLGLPMQLFAHTTGKAYFAEISRLGRRQPEDIRRLTNRIVKRLLILSLPPCAVLLFFGSFLFSFIFGAEWEMAGRFASILSIYLLFQFVSSPLVNVLTVFDKQRMFLYINFLRTSFICLVFGFSSLVSLSPILTITLYSLFLSGFYLYTFYLSYSNIR